MLESNESRKPAGRPSLLSAEQQSALESPSVPVVLATAEAPDVPRRKHVWLVAGVSVLAIAAAFAVVKFGQGQAEPPAAMLASTSVPPPVPAPKPAVAAPAPAAAPVQPAESSPLAALTASAPQAAAIIDEAPPPVEAKPKESLKQMLESGVPAAPKPVVAKTVHKPAKPSEKGAAKPMPEEDNDVELLAALVAHTKFDTSANARMSLPKALEQCKKQGPQDAARCRIRVCEGRWKKDECRAYNRSKLEKTASGA